MGGLACWLIGWLVDWLVDWLVSWLVGNLALTLWDLPNNYEALYEVSPTPPVARLDG